MGSPYVMGSILMLSYGLRFFPFLTWINALKSGCLLFTKGSSNWSKDCLFFRGREKERESAYDSNHLRSGIVLSYIVSQFRIALELQFLHAHWCHLIRLTASHFMFIRCCRFIYSNFQKPMPNNRLLIRSFPLATCYIIQFLLLFLLHFFLSWAQDTHTHNHMLFLQFQYFFSSFF